jgi:tetratricopeptide (TPR) repeat protein
MLYFTSLFPVAYIIYKASNVYGGWRHVMFIYPSRIALTTAGIVWFRDQFSKQWLRAGFISLIMILMAGPVIQIFKNYPLQYIYYNQLVGGVDKAYKKYETDYYLVSLKPGTDWIKKNILPGRKTNTIIISNAPSATIGYYFRNYSDTVSLPYTRYYDRGIYNWDYAVFFMNYIDPYQIRTGIWPPKNTVHEVKVDGVPVCAVVKRENRDDYYGLQLLNEGIKTGNSVKMIQGSRLLEKAISYDKDNEIAYLMLAHGYTLMGRFTLARQKLNELLAIYPEYDKALNLMGYSFLTEASVTKNVSLIDRAIAILNQVIGINYKNTQTYYYLGLGFMMKGNDEQALQYFNKAIDLNPKFKEPYYSIAQMLEKRGNIQEANRYRKYADSL